jgi:hypothetical protein
MATPCNTSDKPVINPSHWKAWKLTHNLFMEIPFASEKSEPSKEELPMGETRLRLPFHGCASSNSNEVRSPRLRIPLFLILSILVLWFVWHVLGK